MISNRLWSVPTVDRAAAAGTLTAYFRCGSRQGKAAVTVADTIDKAGLDARTVDYVAAEISVFRSATAARQKNASRNLRKFLDRDDVARIEADASSEPAALAQTLL